MSGLGFLGLFVYSALYYYGLTYLTSQVACILNYLWPMMLVLFSIIILKEKLTFMKAMAMCCSFVGIVILSMGNGSNMTPQAIIGMVSCIVAAASYGLFSVLNKKVDYDQNIAMMVMWLVTAVSAGALGIFVEEWVPIVGAQWIGMIWLGVVVDAVAYLLWALALQGVENTAKIANLAYMTPFMSLILSAIVLKETIQFRAVVALVFIVGGILLQSCYENFKKK